MPFLLRRLLFNAVSLLIVIAFTFMLMQMAPGDPFLDEQSASHEVHASLMRIHGLHDPLLIQFGRYAGSIFQGDLGSSIKYPGRTVNEIIRESFPVSALLGATALTLSFAGGIIVGVLGAVYGRGWKDSSIKVLTAIGISIPSFILAILLQYVLARKLGIFPIARWGSAAQVFLPAFSLALTPFCYICKLVRTNMLEVMRQDYMKTALAKGLCQSKIFITHALRNALIPLLPYFGQLAANILVGSFVIEKIFSIPGLGQWFVASVNDRDYPVIMGLTVFYSVVLLGILLVADLAGIYLDPRLKTKQAW